ncbi:MAG: Uma2 family endonuclease [Acidobacteriota bacterium]
MAIASPSRDKDRLSISDWAALPDSVRGELVGGRLVEEELPDYVHELLVGWLIHVFGGWAFPRGGLVAGSDAKFAVGPDRGRKPDLTVYFPGSPKPPRRGPVNVPPDVAVEVISPSPRDGRRDRVEKMDDYASFGIRFYWLVDPELRSLEIFELMADGRYARSLGASEGELDVPGCEGLRLDLDGMWRRTDALE